MHPIRFDREYLLLKPASTTNIKIVEASSTELEILKSYADARRDDLRRISFFRFRTRRFLKERFSTATKHLRSKEVRQLRIVLPGLVYQRRNGRRIYYTEIEGLIVQIDPEVTGRMLWILDAEENVLVIRESLDSEVCVSIELRVNQETIIDRTKDIREHLPERAVFPGTFDSIVDDVNSAEVGLFPHERPDYVQGPAYWFHFHDECHRFAQAWCGNEGLRKRR